MDLPVLYAIGAFIQALGQNPGLESELASLGLGSHIYMGTGIGNVDTIAQQTRALDRAQRRWDRYWAEANPDRAAYVAAGGRGDEAQGIPPLPDGDDPE